MKIKFSVSLSFERAPKEEPETPDILEFAGSTTEIHTQPRYAGFAVPEDE